MNCTKCGTTLVGEGGSALTCPKCYPITTSINSMLNTITNQTKLAREALAKAEASLTALEYHMSTKTEQRLSAELRTHILDALENINW